MSDHSSPLTADNAQGSNIACSLGETLALIGDRWVLMILHSAFTGNTRFSDIQRATAMSRSLLTRRLKRMESLGLLSKRLYDEQRNRYDYILTEKGADLADTAMMIVRWEQRWYPGPLHSCRCITPAATAISRRFFPVPIVRKKCFFAICSCVKGPGLD